jgi:hypothetical protein
MGGVGDEVMLEVLQFGENYHGVLQMILQKQSSIQGRYGPIMEKNGR